MKIIINKTSVIMFFTQKNSFINFFDDFPYIIVIAITIIGFGIAFGTLKIAKKILKLHYPKTYCFKDSPGFELFVWFNILAFIWNGINVKNCTFLIIFLTLSSSLSSSSSSSVFSVDFGGCSSAALSAISTSSSSKKEKGFL